MVVLTRIIWLLSVSSTLICYAFNTPVMRMASNSPPSHLIEAAVGWASVKGLEMVAPNEKMRYLHLPISLLPTSFPKTAFDEVIEASPVFNELVDRISRQGSWLEEALQEVASSDDFTGKLLDLFKIIDPATQPCALGIHRSDYMVDKDLTSKTQRLLQVELNTIASSFGCLASASTNLHRYLFERYLLPPKAGGQSDQSLKSFLDDYLEAQGLLHLDAVCEDLTKALPINPTLEKLPDVIAHAHDCYGEKKAVVLFIVQPGERNLFDQRLLEYALWEKYRINIIRLTLEEVQSRCFLKSSKKLYLDDKNEISVVYFRSGYSPADYPSGKEWDARALIEQSLAIKCPNIGYQLAGTKKIQQVLCNPNVLSKFLSSHKCDIVNRHFTEIYSLGTSDLVRLLRRLSGEGLSSIAMKNAIRNPELFVLKPQREGGGNNLYDQDLSYALQNWSEERLSGHILMRKIQAPSKISYLIREGQVTVGPCVSELGIFGTFLGDTSNDNILNNGYAGYLVRTKLSTVNEGGVATGYSCLDSVILS